MIVESTKRPKNEAEAAFYDMMISKGWKVSKRGWPDFFCWNEAAQKIILVEVKPKKGRRLKYHQFFIMRELSKFGVECYKWDLQTETFEVIKAKKEI